MERGKWSKGLTKETSEAVARQSQSLRAYCANPDSTFNSEEYREKQSVAKRRLWTDPNSIYRSPENIQKRSLGLKKAHSNPNTLFNEEVYPKMQSIKNKDTANSWLPPQHCLLYPLTQKSRRSTMSIAVALVGHNSIVLATDSKLTETHMGETSHYETKKLWELSPVVGLMNVTNIAGYPELVINDFIKSTKGNSATFSDTIKAFAQFADKHLSEYVHVGKLPFLVDEGRTDYLLCGYDNQEGRIIKIPWSTAKPIFIPRQITISYCIAGLDKIGRYWARKVNSTNPISKMSTESLEKLAKLIIFETHILEDAVDKSIQIGVIHQEDKKFNLLSKNEIDAIPTEIINIDNFIGN